MMLEAEGATSDALYVMFVFYMKEINNTNIYEENIQLYSINKVNIYNKMMYYSMNGVRSINY